MTAANRTAPCRRKSDFGNPRSRGIPALDEAEAGHLRFSLGREPAAVQQLAFKGGEEAFAHGVVIGVAHRTHRRTHAGLPAPFAEAERRILGRFNWSSQHPDRGGCDGHSETALGPSRARGVAVARASGGGAARGTAAVLGGDRGGSVKRGRGGWRWGVAGGRGTMVSGGGRHATSNACAIVETADRTIPVVCGAGGAFDPARARSWGAFNFCFTAA